MARYFMNHEPLTFEDFDVLVTELTGELVEESPRLDSLTYRLEQAVERIAELEKTVSQLWVRAYGQLQSEMA